MSTKGRFDFGGVWVPVLALAIASAAGCTKPDSVGGTGGSSAASGGHPGTGTGGTPTTTGAGGTPTTTGAGGTPTTTGAGGTPTTTGAGGTPTTTGTGGTTTAGTGGAGGAVVMKDCATKTKVAIPAFMDFENYNGMVDASLFATAFGGTTVNTGTSYAGLDAPWGDGTATEGLQMLAGHASNYAASESVTQASGWGMGGGIWMGCADASAYKGISFWVRGSSGTGTFSFVIGMDSTDMPDSTGAGGGTCPGTTTTCKAPEKDGIPLTTDWAQVQILWADFTPGMSGGTAVVPDGNNIINMTWNVGLAYHLDPTDPDSGTYVAIPGDLRIDIDDIAFIP